MTGKRRNWNKLLWIVRYNFMSSILALQIIFNHSCNWKRTLGRLRFILFIKIAVWKIIVKWIRNDESWNWMYRKKFHGGKKIDFFAFFSPLIKNQIHIFGNKISSLIRCHNFIDIYEELMSLSQYRLFHFILKIELSSSILGTL